MPRNLLKLVPSDSENLKFQPSPNSDGRRIVHIGLGAFARAHIAVLTQLANIEAGEGWRISGVVRSNQSLQESLRRQGHRYVVYEVAQQANGQVIDCIDEIFSWRRDYAAIMTRLSEATTKLATLTVTEKGYCLDHRGRLDLTDENIKLDLQRGVADASPTSTLPGLLCQAAYRRMTESTPGFTVISCDNVSNNGQRLKRALLEYAAATDGKLASWIELNIHCPDTVVDCIVPKVTPEQVKLVQTTLSVDDEAPVLCEPFRQWIITGGEHNDLPRWDLAGAEYVEDCSLYEEHKLRILNAAHSVLAYLGLLQGCRWVCDAMSQAHIRANLNITMEEVLLNFDDQERALEYFRKVIERFENPAMRHALTQIGSDGSNKIPLRWAPSILTNQRNGGANSGMANAIAAWLACWHLLPTSQIAEMSDPQEAAIKRLAQQLRANQSNAKPWERLIGFEPGSTMQKQIKSAFLKHANAIKQRLSSDK